MKIKEVKELLERSFYCKSFIVKRINGCINVEIDSLTIAKKRVEKVLDSFGLKQYKVKYSYNVHRLVDENNLYILIFIIKGLSNKDDVVHLGFYKLSLEYNGLFTFIKIEDSDGNKYMYISDEFMSSYLEETYDAFYFIKFFKKTMINAINALGKHIFK